MSHLLKGRRLMVDVCQISDVGKKTDPYVASGFYGRGEGTSGGCTLNRHDGSENCPKPPKKKKKYKKNE